MIAHDRVMEGLPHQSCSAQVERDGYAIIPDVLTSEEIQTLAVSLEHANLPRSRAGIRHLLSHPEIAQVANDPRMLDIAQQVLGESAFPFKATLFDKSPDANWLIVWHQDTALPLRETHETAGWGPWSVKDGITYAHAPASALKKVVALRLHLDDSTGENGPLRVVPGTHNKGVLTDNEVERRVTEQFTVNCTVNAGGVVAMRPLLIHASSKSQSACSRRVLHIEYCSNMLVGPKLELAIA